MDIVTRTNRKRIIIGIAACIIIIVLAAGKNTRTPVSSSGDEQDNQWDKEEYYIEFEKLFREKQEDLQKFIEIFWDNNILSDKEYVFRFDERWGAGRGDWIDILYSNRTLISEGNDEITKELNNNAELLEILNTIEEKGVILSISQLYSGETRVVSFYVDTKLTSFITTNNGVVNAFTYCENRDIEKYGYRNVEGNWYLWISPPPE